jgi:hypothetical protein
VTESQSTINHEIEQYLRTGESDPIYGAWSGGFMERANLAHEDLRGALAHAVKGRAEGLTHAQLPEADTVSLTRAKVEPMVRGLFPRAEQEVVLATLEQSVVFVTSANIEPLLLKRSFDHSAWTIANLYLASLGAELLAEDAPNLVGFSEETTCYVSPEYFAEDDPFADFIVHEAAHIYHNCKRATIGLRETRTKEWLLDIERPSAHVISRGPCGTRLVSWFGNRMRTKAGPLALSLGTRIQASACSFSARPPAWTFERSVRGAELSADAEHAVPVIVLPGGRVSEPLARHLAHLRHRLCCKET